MRGRGRRRRNDGGGLGARDRGDPRRYRSWGFAQWYPAWMGISLNVGDVSAWANQAGSTGNVSQGVAGLQPAYTASNANMNNQPTVTFTAASADALVNTTENVVAQSSPRTVFAAVRATDAVGGTLIDFRRDGSDFCFQWFHTAGSRFIFSDAVVNITITAPPTLANTNYALTYVDPGTGILPVFRANQVGFAITGGTTMPAETNDVGFAIGTRPAFAQSFQGDINELIVFSMAVDQATFWRIEKGMRARIAA